MSEPTLQRPDHLLPSVEREGQPVSPGEVPLSDLLVVQGWSREMCTAAWLCRALLVKTRTLKWILSFIGSLCRQIRWVWCGTSCWTWPTALQPCSWPFVDDTETTCWGGWTGICTSLAQVVIHLTWVWKCFLNRRKMKSVVIWPGGHCNRQKCCVVWIRHYRGTQGIQDKHASCLYNHIWPIRVWPPQVMCFE